MKNDNQIIFQKYQERFLNKTKRIALRYLDRINQLPGEPKELEYFLNILKDVYVNNKIPNYKENQKLVSSFCATVPNEVIRASGARAIRLCSNSNVGYGVGESFAPNDMCPLTKSILNNLYCNASFAYRDSEMFIIPVTCDCKKNLIERLSAYKPTESLYIPYRRNDDEGIENYINNIKHISDKISALTGVKLTRESLKREIDLETLAKKEIILFSKLKLNKDLLIHGTDSLLVMNALAFDDIASWTKHIKLLNNELLKRKEESQFLSKKRMPRILLAGSPISFPNIKLPLIIEEQGGVIVADETCLGERAYSELISVSEDSLNGYLRAIANSYIKPCSCAIFPDNLARINKLNEIIKEGQIDGIVYHVLHNCLVYEYEYQQIEKYFSEKGIPVIKIETDSNDQDDELINVRISAFLEMITFSKKGGKDNV